MGEAEEGKKISKSYLDVLVTSVSLADAVGDMFTHLGNFEQNDPAVYKEFKNFVENRSNIEKILETMPPELVKVFILSMFQLQDSMKKMNAITTLSADEKRSVGKNLKEVASRFKEVLRKVEEK